MTPPSRSPSGTSESDAVRVRCALSLWALVSGHWSAWQAARVEVNQQSEMDARADQDLAGEVVERVISETDVGPA